jgi:hypothetical protein
VIHRSKDPGPVTMLTVVCGHSVPFDGKPTDPYYQPRLEKVMGRKCRSCRIADAEAVEAAQRLVQQEKMASGTGKGKVKKGQEPKLLPAGATINLIRQENGRWKGKIAAKGIEIEAESAGLMGLGNTLESYWKNLMFPSRVESLEEERGDD